jgi:preprotein translocase subunit SecD
MKYPALILIALLLFVTSLQAADTLPEFAISSTDLQKAALVSHLGKQQTFELTLTSEKSAAFNAFTKSNLKKQVIISLNGQSIASPVIMEPISGEMISFQAGKDLQKYYALLDQVASFKETKAP